MTERLDDDLPTAKVQGEELGRQLVLSLHTAIEESRSWAASATLSELYDDDSVSVVCEGAARGFVQIAILLAEKDMLGVRFERHNVDVRYTPGRIDAYAVGVITRMGEADHFFQRVQLHCRLRKWSVRDERFHVFPALKPRGISCTLLEQPTAGDIVAKKELDEDSDWDTENACDASEKHTTVGDLL